MKQRRGIRRFVIRAGIFLLLGAIVNIAVAWGCAAVFEAGIFRRSYSLSPSVPEHWLREVPATHNRSPAILQRHVSPGFCMTAMAFGSIEANAVPLFVTKRLSGWPCPALYSDTKSSGWGIPEERRYAIEVTLKGRVPYVLPWLPIWPGFALNTLFYAAILWLLFAVPGALRRRRRIKRGLCPACAYPVGAGDLCTECGKPVPARSVRPASP